MIHQFTDPVDPAIVRVVRQLDEATSALEALADVLDDRDELQQGLQRVCQQVVRAVQGADSATVTLLRDQVANTVATTDAQAAEIDAAQQRTGEGPQIDAALVGKVVRVPRAEAFVRWPAFGGAAAELGIHSYLSAPLFVHSEFHGSLNLYSHEPHGFDTLDAALLELYTAAAEAALRAAHRAQQARTRAEQLQQALASRAEIEQAKGIIMGAHRVPADDAFARLIERSQHDNTKLRDIAGRLIAHVTASQ